MRAAHATMVLALMLAACGKGTGGYSSTSPIVPIPHGGDGGADGGDGGSDAGTDAGTDGGPDGGCVGFGAGARPIDSATDYCNGGVTPGSVIAVDSACSVSITLNADGVVCTGRISGFLDAFDGGCQTNTGLLTCVSSSLPGTVSCDAGSSGACSIIFCNGMDCGGP